MFTSVILLKASTEQIPTYKQYKYLRPDPTEAEMAQATVNKEMDIKNLSEVASVTVTKQGDVMFMVIPKEEVLLETEVVITRRNWISFVTVGRPKILQAICDKKDVKFLYHGNSKVAIVVHRDNGSYQVHLMTYSAKGSPRRYLCVYLTARYAILVFPLTMQTALLYITSCLPCSCRPRCALLRGMFVRGFAR